jgi:hypothetical protein
LIRRRSIIPLDIILGFLAGMALGLAYAWVLAPVEYVEADPSRLRADFKAGYREAIAASYSAAGDLGRARARLALLADPDPPQVLNAQAQQMLAAGENFSLVEQVAQLAADIVSTPQVAPPLTVALAATASGSPQGSPSTATVAAMPTQAPASIATPTPRPTQTATPTPGPGFVLIEQKTVCDEDLGASLLQIIVLDSRRRQVPGVELIVTWNGGEDHFFTGFKPELGNGFADFEMEPDLVYAARVGAGGAPVSNLAPPPCSGDGGASFPGSLLLTFAQP